MNSSPAFVFNFKTLIFHIYLSSSMSKFCFIAEVYAGGKQWLSVSVALGGIVVCHGPSPDLQEGTFCYYSTVLSSTLHICMWCKEPWQYHQAQKTSTKSLTIGRDAVRLARLGIASISCGLLHSCGVLCLPIRSHILGWRSRKNMRICSAVWEKKQKRKSEKGKREALASCSTPKPNFNRQIL